MRRCGTWGYWVDACWPAIYTPMLPTRYIQETPPEWMKNVPVGSGGLFDMRTNVVWIHPANNNVVVNAHEYGHWLAWRAMHLFNALWELPWHGLGLGNIFVKERP